MITPGTILMSSQTLRPQCIHLEDEPYPNVWMSMRQTLNPGELETELTSRGWTFFYMANVIRTTAFGFDRAKVIRAAVKRLVTSVKLQKCNCLEIDEVATHSFLGIPYVSVSAHPRHLQKGKVFSGQ